MRIAISRHTPLKFCLLLLFLSTQAFGQSSGGGSNMFVTAIVVIVALVFLWVLIEAANNMLHVEAKKRGVHAKGEFGLFPKLSSLFAPKLPEFIEGDVHFLKRGHDIRLDGKAEKRLEEGTHVTRYALQPPNYHGISPIPKVTVEVGDSVQAGDPVFYDKQVPEIIHVAPVSGEVLEVKRGAKRAITEVVILADKEQQHRKFEVPDLERTSREELKAFLLSSGAWTFFKQRPYDVLPEPSSEPKNIFISTFDSAPLSPDLDFVISGQEPAFQRGLDVLGKLTDGSVFLGLNANVEEAPSSAFTNAQNVEKHWFHGPHPSGNVGIQIHHTAPISAGSTVWVLGVQEVIALGTLFLEGIFDGSRVVALTGTPLKERKYVKTYVGAHIGELLKDNLEDGNYRIVSGDVLSGQIKSRNNYLNTRDDQLTVLKEGDHYELFGWLLGLSERPSVSRTFPSILSRENEFDVDTNTHGEPRAFVMTGQYEKLLPMDILPQHLMKAILTNNFERMEGLGIYELSEEDIALCEFACTSKMPLQQMLREGLEIMREQG